MEAADLSGSPPRPPCALAAAGGFRPPRNFDARVAGWSRLSRVIADRRKLFALAGRPYAPPNPRCRLEMAYGVLLERELGVVDPFATREAVSSAAIRLWIDTSKHVADWRGLDSTAQRWALDLMDYKHTPTAPAIGLMLRRLANHEPDITDLIWDLFAALPR